MVGTYFHKSWDRVAGKVSDANRKELEEHSATTQVDWQQFSDMDGYKNNM